MNSHDIRSVLLILWAVRNGRCRPDVSFDAGRACGYFACLSLHGFISYEERERLDLLLDNAQVHAMAVVFDLEAQGWA
ncbi:hypothetical protein D9M72_631570 [compost metagenome]